MFVTLTGTGLVGRLGLMLASCAVLSEPIRTWRRRFSKQPRSHLQTGIAMIELVHEVFALRIATSTREPASGSAGA
jgi:hypothetical protein